MSLFKHLLKCRLVVRRAVQLLADSDQALGIALHHFTAVDEALIGDLICAQYTELFGALGQPVA